MMSDAVMCQQGFGFFQLLFFDSHLGLFLPMNCRGNCEFTFFHNVETYMPERLDKQ
jgi:hypothetical protein